MIGSGLVRRAGAALGGAALVLAAAAGPLAGSAAAEPDYPPTFHQISASTLLVPSGGSITFRAQTFRPSAEVAFRVVVSGAQSQAGTAVADAKGVVRQSITFDAVGTNTVSFSGTSAKGEPLTLTTKVTVQAADGDGAGDGSGSGTGGAGGSDDDAAGNDGGGLPVVGDLPVVGELPSTGAQVLALAVLGAALVGFGALAVGASRRRRTPA